MILLVRGIINTKNGTELRDKKLEAIGLDKRQYGLHSLRAGGASAAANTGVPDSLFKHHGHGQ